MQDFKIGNNFYRKNEKEENYPQYPWYRTMLSSRSNYKYNASYHYTKESNPVWIGPNQNKDYHLEPELEDSES